MIGGRPSLALVNVFLLSMFLGCGDRSTGDAPSTDTTGAAAPAPASSDSVVGRADSAPAAAVDTGAAVRRDSAQSPPATSAAAAPAPRPTPRPRPAPKAPAPQPPTQAPADTPPAAASPTPSAPASRDTTTATAQGGALRDAYHQAPRDTVSQQVYDGWKQYNLNCARCHGEDVQGTTIAPHLITSLKPDGPINTKELFVQTVCAGRPAKGMPAWCALGLEMDKIEAIHAYVKGRSDGKIHQGRPAVRSQG
jgi:Cytochrome C oxidase, cbb3-type, subunit III